MQTHLTLRDVHLHKDGNKILSYIVSADTRIMTTETT
jgi:hypothetical protein